MCVFLSPDFFSMSPLREEVWRCFLPQKPREPAQKTSLKAGIAETQSTAVSWMHEGAFGRDGKVKDGEREQGAIHRRTS